MAQQQHEIALTIAWICQRELFGRTYAALQPDYFWLMPPDSGVLLSVAVPTPNIVPGAIRPGDIDLLVIPYQRDELVLERTLAIEVKVIRASFAKQGKSPNEYGFTQAAHLSHLGFPYVAIVHLIVSDKSPEHAWRMMGQARILDEEGNIELLPPQLVDWLPVDLVKRAYGRLEANSQSTAHGLGAVYVENWISGKAAPLSSRDFWLPDCRKATLNQNTSPKLLEHVADYYEHNRRRFLATPRHDP